MNHGYRAVVEVLLEGGTDPNFLSSAINNDQDYDISAESTWGALEIAARVGDVEILELLLNARADVNANDGVALRHAVQHGHEKIVKLLLNSGADAGVGDGIALRWVARRGNANIVKLLLDAGADANATDGIALRQATNPSHEKIVEALLNSCADVNARRDPDIQGPYALSTAALHGNLEFARLLLTAGVNANAGDGSALRAAVRGGYVEIVKLLLTAGADATAEGGSAYRVAAWAGHWKIAELLRNVSTGIYSAAESVIQEAAWRSRLNATQLLANAGIEANGQPESTARAAVELPALTWIPRIGAGVEGRFANLGAAVNGGVDLVRPLPGAGADADAVGGYAVRAARWVGQQGSVNLPHYTRHDGDYEDLSYARAAAWYHHLQTVEVLYNAVIRADAQDAPTQEPVELPAPTWIPKNGAGRRNRSRIWGGW